MATVVVKHHPSGGPADALALVDGPTYDADPHIVTGLENVDNTSDANKPVSTAQAAYIAAAVLPTGSGTAINMKAAGCDSTGVVDCSSIIQAVANANTAGNRIFFPAGSYTFSGITSSTPLYVFGVGNGSGPGADSNTQVTQFFLNSSTANLFTVTSLYESTFRDFQINVPVAKRPMSSGAGISLLGPAPNFTNANSKIENVSFTNVYTPIRLFRTVLSTICGCYFDNWINAAISITTSSGIEGGGGFIYGNYFNGNSSSTPMLYSEVGYTDFHDNLLTGGNIGVSFNITNNPAGGIRVHDNWIENFSSVGVKVQSGDGSAASQLLIHNNSFFGLANNISSIFVVDSTVTPTWMSNVIVTGNTCRSSTGAGGKCIWVGAATNGVISNNILDESGANSPIGINIAGASTNAGLVAPIQVLDNSFIGTFSARYNIAGGTPVVRDLIGMTFAALPTGIGAGTMIYVTDGKPNSSPLTGSSTGAYGIYQNAAWIGVGSITYGTGVATALGVNVGTAGSVVVNGGALGTPSSGTLSSATGLPISTGVSGLGTGVATLLGGNSSGTGGPAGTISPTFTGSPILAAPSATTAIVGSSVTRPAGDVAVITGNATTLPVSGGGALLHLGTVDGGQTVVVQDGFAAALGNVYRRANNTAASLSALALDNVVMSLVSQGYGATGYATTARAYIRTFAAEAWSDTAQGMYAAIATTPPTTAAAVESMRWQASGGVSVGTTTDPGIGAILANTSIKSQAATAGIGYATGAGGAITQGTNRTTGVTLNTVTGAITLFSQVNTAVSAATAQTFTLTSSAIAAADVVHVTQKSGTDKYLIFVTNTVAGSCQITNFTTGGVTNEAPVFSFVVIKGVTS